jgi:hypothetical protein
MTIQAASLLELGGTNQQSWGTELDSSSSTALEKKGAVRWDQHPIYGLRGFQYLRCDQSGGCTAGQLQSFVANTAINNISSGTTTSITTSGLTANIHVDGILYCLDDNGGAGAAPEGEKARIVANTTTLVTVNKNDAFSAAPAANDDFVVVKHWAVGDSADGDFAAAVAGVAMADQDQYDWGWFQFYGINPSVDAIAAGTALPTGESIVANVAVVNDGAGDAVDLRVGKILHALSSDTVLRKAMVDLFCGAAFKMSNSTA